MQLEILLVWGEQLQQELFQQEIDQLDYQDMKILYKQMHQLIQEILVDLYLIWREM